MKPSHDTPMLSFAFLFLISSERLSALQLNVTGYERCIFNFAIAPQAGNNRATLDFVDHFVSYNPVIQLWTMLKIPDINSYVDSMLLTSRYLKEKCSINVFVSIVGCSKVNLGSVFGSRIYHPHNVLYIVLGNPPICSETNRLRHVDFATRANLNIVHLLLAQDNLNVETALLWSPNCLNNEVFELPVDYKNLLQLREFSAEVKRRSAIPEVALLSSYDEAAHPDYVKQCGYLYKVVFLM